jgi:exonuclease III
LPSSLISTQVTPFASTAHNFAPSLSSPSLDDTSNTISFASLNVKGFASNVLKFDAIMDDLFNKDLSVIGLQETHTAERTAELMFKNRCALWTDTYPYRAYWSYNPSDSYSGVGIIVKSFVSTYVQKVTRFEGRYIAIDLFLPARKIRVINIYNQQKLNWLSSRTNKGHCGKSLAQFAISQITEAESKGFSVIVLGDFNLDPSVYLNKLAKGLSIPTHYKLVEFLFDRNYIN